MANVNTNPIFTCAPVTSIKRLTGQAAYTGGSPAGYDLSGATVDTNAWLVFSADNNYGSYVQKIRWRALGANANATVCRVFLNNGGATTTAANNVLIDEISLPIVAASTSAATALFELPLNVAIAPTYRLYVTYGTANAANGYDVTVFGGNYTAT